MISILKENGQTLGLFVAKYPGKKEASSCPLTIYLLALPTNQGTLYEPRTKHLFRNYLIDFSAAFVEIPSELNPVMIYDAMAIIVLLHHNQHGKIYSKFLLKCTS